MIADLTRQPHSRSSKVSSSTKFIALHFRGNPQRVLALGEVVVFTSNARNNHHNQIINISRGLERDCCLISSMLAGVWLFCLYLHPKLFFVWYSFHSLARKTKRKKGKTPQYQMFIKCCVLV